MKFAVQLVVLLACVFLCTSGNPITKCRCIRTVPAVRRHLIADVKVDEPNPICSKQEVIAIMKDNNQRCLDPESDFTKRLLREFFPQRTASTEKHSTKTTTTKTTTTTTTTTAATTKSAATSTSVRRQ
ncbi:growth-regulated alpha protein-like [Xiphophorus hellerii]|uniref:growth-regulated alpha protein-like n=1 Tax=Xiphophorus hellerii TaxID=8084 RepID=UPI0013B406BF|nr:growth-regulated alpha protein-like [Xiphophorus hellerii]